jgi:DNA-binding MarR family transcriptional regulator
MEISEKEFAVIREISNNHLPDQRTIAIRTGISLGLTNLIIKRLINKGYIKAKQLNQKKIQYLLTPKGFSEKAKKSYNYTLKTFGMLKSFRERIKGLLKECQSPEVEAFRLIGGNEELAYITEAVIDDLPELKEKYIREKDSQLYKDTLILSFISKDKEKGTKIDLVTYLSNTGLFY